MKDKPYDPNDEFDDIDAVRKDFRIPLPLLRDILVAEARPEIDTETVFHHTTSGGNVIVARKVEGVDSIDFWVNPGR